jgi:hypothetical protein
MTQTVASIDVGGTGLSTVGTSGYFLQSTGTGLQYAAVSSTTFSAGTTGFTPNTATSGNVTLAGTLNIANGGTGLTSFTAGQIHFGSFSQSSNLYWDNTNFRLGIQTSSPTVPLDVRGNGYFISGSSPTSFWSVDSGLNTGSGYCQWNTSVTSFISGSYTNHPYYFVTNNTERMRITTSGGISFGATGTAYGSSGQLLQSNGNAAPTWVNNPLYSVDFLVVGGGGGGGGAYVGGGGGAGGYLTGSFVVTSGNAYTAGVGAGGNGGGTSKPSPGTNGATSSFNGMLAIGGGFGATGNSSVVAATAGSGGSGGGAGAYGIPSPFYGYGVAGEGNRGGSGYDGTANFTAAGGGGGASAVGGDANSVPSGNANAGNGGNGSTWFNGTTYAGGGGGGTDLGGGGRSGTAGTGGTGGGGNGQAWTGTAPTAGTANTGGGGGGGGGNGAGAAGGSGIVIIRYLSATQKGSGGTVTSSGGYYYHTFTTSGTYTA